MCAYSTSELYFSHSLLLLTENILKWIDPFIRSLQARSVHDIDARLQLSASLSHYHPIRYYIRLARFSSCCCFAIYIKIYALFNHEFVVVRVQAFYSFFLVADYFFACCYYFIWMDHNKKNKTDLNGKTCNFSNECRCNRWISCITMRRNEFKQPTTRCIWEMKWRDKMLSVDNNKNIIITIHKR